MEITGSPLEAEQGQQSGPILSNGQRQSGQSIRLEGNVPTDGVDPSNGVTLMQVEIRLGSQQQPLNLSDDKVYKVTVEEVTE